MTFFVENLKQFSNFAIYRTAYEDYASDRRQDR